MVTEIRTSIKKSVGGGGGGIHCSFCFVLTLMTGTVCMVD